MRKSLPNASPYAKDLAQPALFASESVPAYGAPAPPSSQLFEYWTILRANFAFIALCSFIGAMFGLLAFLLQSSKYQARTVLDIRSLNENFLSSRENTPVGSSGNVLPETYIQTEIKILQSELLKKKALSHLANAQATAADLESGDQSSPSFWEQISSRFDPSLVPFQELVADAGRHIKVRAVGNTRIVEILCDARDAQLAASVCNSMAKTYIEYNLESRYQSTKETGDWLQSQLDDVRKRLTKAENELKSSASSPAAVGSSEESDSLAQDKLRQLQSELSRLQAERMTRESEYQTAVTRTASTLPLSLDVGTIRDYRIKLDDLKGQLAEATATMTPEHYRVRDLQRQIKNIEGDLEHERTDLMDRLKAEYDSAVHKESLLKAAYNKQLSVVGQEGSRSVQQNMLRRDVDTERRLYETLLQKVDEVGLATAMRTSTISVVDPAVPPAAAYSPKQAVNIGLGAFGGACLGLMISFFRMRSDRSLHGPGESAYHLPLRELGVIPFLQPNRVHGLLRSSPLLNWFFKPAVLELGTAHLSHQRDGMPSIVANRSNPVVEAFFATMNSLLFSVKDSEQNRVIAITSPSSGDGKSTVTSNLALAFAWIGRRVVIVDGDLRKPSLHRLFNIDVREGLAEILEHKEKLEKTPVLELVYKTDISGLYILPASVGGHGTVPKLHSDALRHLLKRLRSEFDVVIIDTPPMMQLSDARVLGSLADGVVLVLKSRITTIDEAVAVYSCLRQDGIKVFGTVLNAWNRNSPTYGAYPAVVTSAEGFAR